MKSQYLNLVDSWIKPANKKAWKLYRGGGAVIGLAFVYHLIAIPVAALLRQINPRKGQEALANGNESLHKCGS